MTPEAVSEQAWLEVCPECLFVQGATLMEEPHLCPNLNEQHKGIPPRLVRVNPAARAQALVERVEGWIETYGPQLPERVVGDLRQALHRPRASLPPQEQVDG